jgi:hypothetical protein
MFEITGRKRSIVLSLFAVLATHLLVADAEILVGATGSSPKWGSGWIDFAPPVDFARGEKVRITVRGSAERILVRFLSKGQPPDESVGVVGGPIVVPRSGIVELVLPDHRRQIVQISVHGGPNPWGKYPLGGGNGPATLESVERLSP